MKHLDYIRGLPCCICGNNIETEAAHIRMRDPRVGKQSPGIGRKPSDEFVIPLCSRHHHEQHRFGERNFWEHIGINPVPIAMALYRVSGDNEAGEQIVQEARR